MTIRSLLTPAPRTLAALALLLVALACTRREPPAAHVWPAEPAAPSAATSSTTALGTTSTSAPASDPPGTYMGRPLAPTMSYRGADWLERSDREAREQPEHVLDVLAIPAGSTVADVGAGTGYFTVRLARRLGPAGRVLATDLQPEMLRMLGDRLADAGITNVTPVLASPDDAKLPRGQVDLMLMVDVYHELSDPRGTLAQIRDALRPSGRLALVEYRGEDPAVPIKPEHKMTLVQIRRELEASGFTFVRSDESLPDQRIVVFRR